VNVLSLFSGIEGLGLGLERAGMKVVGQVEIDPFCRQVLDIHYPKVPKHDDVRTCVDWWRSTVRPSVDLIAGGFPCQPFSTFGLGRGMADERWGWPWMRDVIDALRPRLVLIENVDELLRDTRAFHCVLSDLSDRGFDAEWSLASACSVGAPHMRDRVFVLAYPAGRDGEQPLHLPAAMAEGRAGSGAAGGDAWPDGWLPEPDVGRVADGVPKRLVAPHLHALGNAVVPQVAEVIGRMIMDFEGAAA
jgi:DNA (cytosine-5)-methyltransferase 1